MLHTFYHNLNTGRIAEVRSRLVGPIEPQESMDERYKNFGPYHYPVQVFCYSSEMSFQGDSYRGQTENAPNFRAISEIPGLLDAADTLNYYMLIEFL